MLLKVEDLKKTYLSGKVIVKALNGIDLEVEEKEFTAIVGPSGSGKTTLLNIIGCIDSTDSGKVSLDGKEITNKTSKELALLRREYFGFIFQSYNLIPVLNIFENIELPLKLLGKHSKKEIENAVLKILDEVGLNGLEKRMPLELSGGQQQRVSIARALVKKPKMVLADEPTANLDSKTGEAIVDIMRDMNEVEGVTFIFSTHDELIMKHAKRTIHLRDGLVV
ncbi:ABC transporter ATP-binding protein [bacterium]|nr:ABC transporter ATP-binding protein [bacterium]